MKKIVFMFVALAAVIMLTSCDKESSYDTGLKVEAKNPTPQDPTPQDTISQADPTWGTPVRQSLFPVGEPGEASHMWHATQTFYDGRGDSLVKRAECPVGYSLSPSTGLSSARTNEAARLKGSSSINLTSAAVTPGDWYVDNEGNTLREVTVQTTVETTEFNKVLTLTRVEGYSTVDGVERAFKSHSVSAVAAQPRVIETTEVVREDSLFEQTTYELKVNVTFKGDIKFRTYVVSADHTVERFVRVETTTPPTPKTPCKWTMTGATLVFNPNGSVSGSHGAFHVCLAFKNETDQEWGIAVTSSYGNPNAQDFVLKKWGFSVVPGNLKINSAVMRDGQWIPAHLSGSGQSWSYYSYDNSWHVDMTMSEAVICGIKNFTGSHTAENSAKLNYTATEESDGTLVVRNHLGGEVYHIK